MSIATQSTDSTAVNPKLEALRKAVIANLAAFEAKQQLERLLFKGDMSNDEEPTDAQYNKLHDLIENLAGGYPGTGNIIDGLAITEEHLAQAEAIFG